MYYLYILLCDKAFFYIGVTMNINKRLREHKNGYSPHTKRYQNIKLVHSEGYPSEIEAKDREKQIKGWTREKKKALIEGDIEKLRKLSKSKS